MLVHIKEIVNQIDKNNQAVGAFNTHNLEFCKAIIKGAEIEKFPLIIQTSETSLKYAGIKNIFNIIKNISDQIDVPIAIHLDHGKNLPIIKSCIKTGFSSVMIDGSNLPFDENVKVTKEVVDFSKKYGVWVQGELGRVMNSKDIKTFQENPEKFYTIPEKAKEFVEKTGVNTLAVSIGTIHGTYKIKNKAPKLSIKRLKEIREQVKIPFVLHGASKIKKESIVSTIENGIRIINIDTELREAFRSGLDNVLKNKDEFDPRKILKNASEGVTDVVRKKINIFKL